MTPPKADPQDQLLDAALMHVPFDGWSPATFNAAIKDSGLDPALARAVCPRGAVDLAVAYHRRGDAKYGIVTKDYVLTKDKKGDK